MTETESEELVISQRFVDLINCLVEISNEIYSSAPGLKYLKYGLDSIPKKHFGISNLDYKRIKNLFEDLYKGACERASTIADHFGFALSYPEKPSEVEVYRFCISEKDVGLHGILNDEGYKYHPTIEVKFEKTYRADPLKSLWQISKVYTEFPMVDQEINNMYVGSFLLNKLKNIKELKGLKPKVELEVTAFPFFQGKFSSKIRMEREDKYLAPNGVRGKWDYFPRIKLKCSINIQPLTHHHSLGRNVETKILYRIVCNRNKVVLPEEEIEWLKRNIPKLIPTEEVLRNI